MEKITLRHQTDAGLPLEATFAPSEGINLTSYRRGGVEFIDSATKQEFEETNSGLGAIIGPHYGDRLAGIIPSLPDTSPWPHIERLRKQGHQDPFFNGVGRYAPWQVESDATTLKATLAGKQEWQGRLLSGLEGQNFVMSFKATLGAKGLNIIYSVISDSDSVVGLDYHFRLPGGKGTVTSDVKDYYLENKETKTIPSNWRYDTNKNLSVELNRSANYTFYPFRNPLEGNIYLETPEYRLAILYRSKCQENSWQLIHHEGTNSVRIRPISAKLPHRPTLTVSTINVDLLPL